jgi:hypothetical protein
MPVISIPLLKTKFETGDRPTGADYVDLIDTTSYYAVSLEARVEALELSDNTIITGEITTNSPTVIDEWTLGELLTIEYLVQIVQGTKQYCEKILIMSNESIVNHTKYGIMSIGDDITGLSITAVPDLGQGKLIVTVSDATETNASVKVLKTAIS